MVRLYGEKRTGYGPRHRDDGTDAQAEINFIALLRETEKAGK